MLTSRSRILGWCLVAVLAMPWAVIAALAGASWLGPRPALLALGACTVLTALRMAAWFFFQRYWRDADRLHHERANRRLGAIADSCQEMLWEIRNGRFSYLTPIVTDYLGYHSDELLGQPLSVIIADCDQERVRSILRTCAVDGCGWKDEHTTFRTKDGEERDFIFNGLSQIDSDGKVAGFAGTLRGIEGLSDRQRARQNEQRIRDLIADQQISTVFQPIIGCDSGLALGAEALSRFPDATMNTEQWFTTAARAGLAVDLELTTLRQALRAAATSLPEHLFLSVNLSPATLTSGALDTVIDESRWDPTRIVVEVTEHASIENYQLLSERTSALRRRGMRIAVDDAGAGYASMRHILALRPDHIKLDRHLISDVDTDPGKRALVKAVLSFAGDIGAIVIAEGVQTAAELRALRRLGVQAAQGYFIAKPAPIDDWPENYLRTHQFHLPSQLWVKPPEPPAGA